MKGSSNATNGKYHCSNPGIYLEGTKNDLVINVELQSGEESNSLTPSSSDDVSFALCKVSNIPLQDGFALIFHFTII